jgi:hypothetical protein
LTGSAEYNSEEGSVGVIHLYVGLSTDGTILGLDLPKEEYGHSTTSAFYPKVASYVASIVGDNIESFDGQDDLSAGASNSRTLVDILLTLLGGNWE